MRLWIWAGLTGLLLGAAVSCGVLESEPTPTPIPTPTRTPSPTPTPVPLNSMTFNVPAGQVYDVRIRAGLGYSIEFRFDANLDITVSLYNPEGFEVDRWERIESHSGVRHTTAASGDYFLRFDNSFSLFTAKRVTLRSRAVPPWGR